MRQRVTVRTVNVREDEITNPRIMILILPLSSLMSSCLSIIRGTSDRNRSFSLHSQSIKQGNTVCSQTGCFVKRLTLAIIPHPTRTYACVSDICLCLGTLGD